MGLFSEQLWVDDVGMDVHPALPLVAVMRLLRNRGGACCAGRGRWCALS